jgi:inner membrane protein
MDTLTHALSGALLARLLVVQRATVVSTHSAPSTSSTSQIPLWQCVVVGTVAGAFPDIDAVAQAFGDIAYLTQHRGITHALPMLPLWAAGLAWLMTRCFASTRGVPGAWRQFFVLAAGGIGIHIAGDWITQFGTMLLQPFSNQRFGLGAMFIIDLAFSGFLLAGLLLAAVFPRRRWPAALGLGVATAWVGLAWVGQQEAQHIALRHAAAQGLQVQQVVVMPRPASPFNWTVSVFDGHHYHVAHLNTRRTAVLDPEAPAVFPPLFVRRFSAPYMPADQATWARVPRFGDAGTPAWVQEAWAHPSFAFFRWFAQTPALIEASDTDGQRCASFRDLRFEWPGRDESPFRYGLCLPAQAGGSASLFKIEDGVRKAL